ncbi:NAD-dependent epimerase/dehydratase family protein [Rhodoplanes roseus]|uniref:dTDP-glucose 4,6-dehydratase n=1 Tax=Rhodoplanes roseus TaxID=29409 RepID=A0A327L5L0_9BRAD|nr:NAD(P)-dependent oxidoreductase [Rhodoplanes roseus]RAI45667.1 dTDP-glucose 4,6-dehydratase [Rhodoplanes roseus]
MRIFVAGATGVIGRRLVPMLVRDGHEVTGTTRLPDKAVALQRAGARPAVVDVFDGPALAAAVAQAHPDVVIHQLTDLPDLLDAEGLNEALARNARIRVEGTCNLVAAVQAAKVPRLIAQSIAFAYADGPRPFTEASPLAAREGGPQAVTARGVHALEELVTQMPGFDGLVLRYGRLYGPGTWAETPPAGAPLHVDAAAEAARLAISRGAPGLYNIAEEDGEVAIDKARAELGFDPAFRLTELAAEARPAGTAG